MKYIILLIIGLCLLISCSDAANISANTSSYVYINYTYPNYNYTWHWNYTNASYTNITTNVTIYNEIGHLVPAFITNASNISSTNQSVNQSVNQSLNQTIIILPQALFGVFGIFNPFIFIIFTIMFVMMLMNNRTSALYIVCMIIIAANYLFFNNTLGWALNIAISVIVLLFIYNLIIRESHREIEPIKNVTKPVYNDIESINKELDKTLKCDKKLPDFPETKSVIQKSKVSEQKSDEPYILDVGGSYIKEL